MKTHITVRKKIKISLSFEIFFICKLLQKPAKFERVEATTSQVRKFYFHFERYIFWGGIEKHMSQSLNSLILMQK